jgi:hypothetical protein
MGLAACYSETTVIHKLPYLCEMLVSGTTLRNIFNWKS